MVFNTRNNVSIILFHMYAFWLMHIIILLLYACIFVYIGHIHIIYIRMYIIMIDDIACI